MGHVSEKDDQLTLNFFPNPLGTQSNTRIPQWNPSYLCRENMVLFVCTVRRERKENGRQSELRNDST